ncbi:MAG: AAC(3) family N-acetyltransferase [Helicobacter sp.]|nr:AAC(3) family N-acetyltransferase [Helicobacteraceae bacterium]MDY3114066.1 AAC(3) family N-acetyltransferase [Helicobacter sp.]
MKSYQIEEVESIFLSAGLKNDDALLVHSALNLLGKCDNCDFSEIPLMWINMLESLCKNGALLMPCFNYSFPTTHFADLRSLKSEVGILSEVFRGMAKKRSLHPMFSFCGSGARVGEFIAKTPEFNPFLQDSTYHRLFLENALMAFVGIDIRVCTFMVYIEATFGVKYRYFKPFSGRIISLSGNEIDGEFYHFCLPQGEKLQVNFFRVQELMLKSGIIKRFPLGAKNIYIFRAQDFFNFIVESLQKDPFILLEHPPRHFYEFKDKEVRVE